MKTILREYQETARDKAVAALTGGGGFLLLPEQRTGKTLIALSVVDCLRNPTDCYKLVIVCPKVAIPVWKKAIKQETKRGWLVEIHILNYEQYVANKKFWYKWAKDNAGKFFMIGDETHLIKARGATRSRVTRHISRQAKYRLALTGTPIANGLIDAWAQFDFIDPTIFGKFDDTIDRKTKQIVKEGFNGRYIRWGGYKQHQIVGYRNKKKFNEIFHKHSYRITLREAKKQGGQPSLKLQITKSFVDLSARSRFHYDEMLAELQTIVDGKTVKVKNLLACIVKLQQICGGHLIIPEENGPNWVQNVGQEKLDKLHEIVRSLRSGMKFIVVCRYIHEIERVDGFLRRLGYTTNIVRGGQPFDGKFTCDCVVMQIQSGMAVDMSQADAILFYSTDYSYLNFEQARFRILSYAKEYARYYFLLARETIDEQIFEAVTRKKNLAKLVIDTYRRTRK